ncbi:hypothetical protein AAC691_15500 [Nguyenibacter vanlangensis]|uniref:Uncharacterized protein n=1 Tax=Nguyenibacter vanlangensis TaxID=1216886 RepID=A0ABZ3D2E1_9PROT
MIGAILLAVAGAIEFARGEVIVGADYLMLAGLFYGATNRDDRGGYA